MKRIRCVCLLVLMLMMFSACSNTEQTGITNPSNSDTVSEQESQASENNNSELDGTWKNPNRLFFVGRKCRAGQYRCHDIPQRFSPGKCSTARLHGISGETGGDLFSIQVTNPYPADWDRMLKPCE